MYLGNSPSYPLKPRFLWWAIPIPFFEDVNLTGGFVGVDI